MNARYILVCQFLSSILAGSEIADFLIASANVRRTHDFHTVHGGRCASSLRETVLEAHSAEFVRGIHRFRQYPWLCAELVDEDRPLEVHSARKRDMFEAAAWRLDRGVTAKIVRKHRDNPANFDLPTERQKIKVWVKSHKGKSLLSEKDHTALRRLLKRSTAWRHVQARGILRTALDNTFYEQSGSTLGGKDSCVKSDKKHGTVKSLILRYFNWCRGRDAGGEASGDMSEYWKKSQAII